MLNGWGRLHFSCEFRAWYTLIKEKLFCFPSLSRLSKPEARLMHLQTERGFWSHKNYRGHTKSKRSHEKKNQLLSSLALLALLWNLKSSFTKLKSKCSSSAIALFFHSKTTKFRFVSLVSFASLFLARKRFITQDKSIDTR